VGLNIGLKLNKLQNHYKFQITNYKLVMKNITIICLSLVLICSVVFNFELHSLNNSLLKEPIVVGKDTVTVTDTFYVHDTVALVEPFITFQGINLPKKGLYMINNNYEAWGNSAYVTLFSYNGKLYAMHGELPNGCLKYAVTDKLHYWFDENRMKLVKVQIAASKFEKITDDKAFLEGLNNPCAKY
jgi:hypothetical protein